MSTSGATTNPSVSLSQERTNGRHIQGPTHRRNSQSQHIQQNRQITSNQKNEIHSQHGAYNAHHAFQGVLIMPELHNISTIPNLPNINNIDVTAGQNLYQQFLKNQIKEKARNYVTLAKDKNGITVIVQNNGQQFTPNTKEQPSPTYVQVNQNNLINSINHRASSSKIMKLQAGNCDSVPRGAGFFTGPVSPLKMMMKNENSLAKFGNAAIPGIQNILNKYPQNQQERKNLGTKSQVDQVNNDNNFGPIGAVGTQMNLQMQSQITSPKTVPEKNQQKPPLESGAKLIKEYTENLNKTSKRASDTIQFQRNQSNHRQQRNSNMEANGSRNLSPASLIQASQIQANSLLDQQMIKMLPIQTPVQPSGTQSGQTSIYQHQQQTQGQPQQSNNSNTPGLQFNPETNGIMIQGMSKDRAMKFQRRIIQEQHVQFLLNQKMVQEELERNIIQNYYNLNQNKYHMSISDIQRTLAHQQALQLKHQELQDLQLQHQILFDGNFALIQKKTHDRFQQSKGNNGNPLEATKIALLTKTERKEGLQNQDQTSNNCQMQSVSPKKQATFKVRQNTINTTGKKGASSYKEPQEIPPTKIKIWHEFDNSLHFHHKFNITVRNINLVVRLIFKNTKDQSAITAMSQGTSVSQIQSQIDENRLREIQKIASTMKVNIPKRFESKTAIREFIQSREFIAAMKQSMNSQLFLVINNGNKILNLVNAKLEKQQRMHGGGALQRKDRDNKDTSQNASNQPSIVNRDGTNTNQTRLNSPQKKTNPNLLENSKQSRKRSMINGSAAAELSSHNVRPTDSRQNSHLNIKRGNTIHEHSMGKTSSNFYQTQNGFGDKDKKSSKKKKESKCGQPNTDYQNHQKINLIKQKKEKERQKEKDVEQDQFEKEIEQCIQDEALRREEEELEPLTKEDKLNIRQRIIREKERLLEKEKLLQITQKYFIGYGNNHQVVKNVIKQRYWWTQACQEDFLDANFIWTSWKRDKHIEFLKHKGQNSVDAPIKIYGKMNNNKHLANKKGVFINMRDYYQMKGIDPFSILPLTYLIQNSNDSEYKKLEKEYQRIQKLKKTNKQIANRLINQHLAKKKQELIAKGQKPQKINRVSNYRKYSYYDSDDEHSTAADSFFPEDYEDDEMRAIRDKYPVPLNTWIVKPGENSNRGCGINVVHDMHEVRQLVSSAGGINSVGYQKTFIVQKYIDNPFLIHRRKFDFRVFALVTCINKSLKAYFYEDGYIRTSSKEFDLDNLDDKFIHLTNDAIQKQGEDFGKFENCNKLSYSDFQRYLNQYHADLEIDVMKHIVPQMKRLIVDTIRATCFKLDPLRLANSFEIFGYDFMLDDRFKLSLIEVNTNPCLETESPLLARIIPELIDNTFKIVLDPIFPSPDLSSNRKLLINELPQEIKYQLIFDEDIEGPALKQLFNQFYDGLDYDVSDDVKRVGPDGKPIPGAKKPKRPLDEIASDNEDELEEMDREEEEEFEEEDDLQ